jgi:hypothetical protein
LPDFIPPNAPTPLWTAIDRAIGEFRAADGRHVVLVMSDGKDCGPDGASIESHNPTVADRAQRDDVMVYAIGLQSHGPMPMGPGTGESREMMVANLVDPGLGTTALETGGGCFEIRPREDLGAAPG